MQADRQGAVVVDAASPAKANMHWIKCDPLRARRAYPVLRFADRLE
jgi:hypothetical protein